MKIDIFAKLNKIPNAKAKHLLIDKIMERVVPFNRGMGFKVKTLSKAKVEVESPNKKRRQNHRGGDHRQPRHPRERRGFLREKQWHGGVQTTQ